MTSPVCGRFFLPVGAERHFFDYEAAFLSRVVNPDGEFITAVAEGRTASPDVAEHHYNLARSIKAGHRFAVHLAKARSSLRPISNKE